MRCSICEKEIKKNEEKGYKPPWFINARVVGEAMEIYGHRTCLQNVDAVVIANRLRLTGTPMDLKTMKRVLKEGRK
jgi:hypothetical protein